MLSELASADGVRVDTGRVAEVFVGDHETVAALSTPLDDAATYST